MTDPTREREAVGVVHPETLLDVSEDLGNRAAKTLEDLREQSRIQIESMFKPGSCALKFWKQKLGV